MDDILETGLRTCTKPMSNINVPIGLPKLECFLNELEDELISRVEDCFYNNKLLGNFDDEENSVRSKSIMKSQN